MSEGATWDDVITVSEQYITLLSQKLHSMDALDCRYRHMWAQRLVVAMCRHQEIVRQARECQLTSNRG